MTHKTYDIGNIRALLRKEHRSETEIQDVRDFFEDSGPLDSRQRQLLRENGYDFIEAGNMAYEDALSILEQRSLSSRD